MKYSAKAIGSASEVAQAQLEEEYKADISIDDAILLALKILKQVMEEKIDQTNVQLALATSKNGFEVVQHARLSEYLAKI